MCNVAILRKHFLKGNDFCKSSEEMYKCTNISSHKMNDSVVLYSVCRCHCTEGLECVITTACVSG